MGKAEAAFKVPGFVLKAAIKMIQSSVLKKAGLDMYKLKPIADVDKCVSHNLSPSHVPRHNASLALLCASRCFIPALFVAGESDDFISPQHSQQMSVVAVDPCRHAGSPYLCVPDMTSTQATRTWFWCLVVTTLSDPSFVWIPLPSSYVPPCGLTQRCVRVWVCVCVCVCVLMCTRVDVLMPLPVAPLVSTASREPCLTGPPSSSLGAGVAAVLTSEPRGLTTWRSK